MQIKELPSTAIIALSHLLPAQSNPGDVTSKVTLQQLRDLFQTDFLPPASPNQFLRINGAGDDVVGVTGVGRFVATRTEMKAVDVAVDTAIYLTEAGREGQWFWNPADLSSILTPTAFTVPSVGIDTGTEIFTMKSVTTTSVSSATDIATSAGHGLAADQEVFSLTSVNGITAFARYFVFFDAGTAAAGGGNTDNFKLRTSLSAAALDLTGTTNFTVRIPHDLYSGMPIMPSATLNGLTADTPVYVIRTNAGQFQVASTYANAHAGTAMNITGTSAITFRRHADPLEGRFVIPTGKAANGSQGAFVRNSFDVRVTDCGAKGDGATDDGHAMQMAIYLARLLNKRCRWPTGIYMTSTPLSHKTNGWLVNYSTSQGAHNGVSWFGDGREKSIVMANSSFPNGTYLVYFDGNPNALSAVVGSRPMSQGDNLIDGISFQGRGRTTGTNKAVACRACWNMEWHDVDISAFSGDAVTLVTGATVTPGDEVDNNYQWLFRRVRIQDCAGNGFMMNAARIVHFELIDSEILSNALNGIDGALVNSRIEGTVFASNGQRSTATSGGIRLEDALTGSLCRNVTIRNCSFEANFNHEIDVVMCRGLTIQDCNVNMYLPTGGVVTNKAAIKIRDGAGGGTKYVNLLNNIFADYAAPTDGSIYEAFYYDIATGVTDVNLIGMFPGHATSHVKAVAPTRLNMIGVPSTLDYSLTGTFNDVFLNGESLGARSGSFTATYNPPSIAAGAVDTIQTIAVAGAAMGDIVDATFSVNLNGVKLTAWVSVAGTVSYQFHNPTAGAIDLASGTVKVRLRKVN